MIRSGPKAMNLHFWSNNGGCRHFNIMLSSPHCGHFTDSGLHFYFKYVILTIVLMERRVKGCTEFPVINEPNQHIRNITGVCRPALFWYVRGTGNSVIFLLVQDPFSVIQTERMLIKRCKDLLHLFLYRFLGKRLMLEGHRRTFHLKLGKRRTAELSMKKE